jgi:hypothetical protein
VVDHRARRNEILLGRMEDLSQGEDDSLYGEAAYAWPEPGVPCRGRPPGLGSKKLGLPKWFVDAAGDVQWLN